MFLELFYWNWIVFFGGKFKSLIFAIDPRTLSTWSLISPSNRKSPDDFAMHFSVVTFYRKMLEFCQRYVYNKIKFFHSFSLLVWLFFIKIYFFVVLVQLIPPVYLNKRNEGIGWYKKRRKLFKRKQHKYEGTVTKSVRKFGWVLCRF